MILTYNITPTPLETLGEHLRSLRNQDYASSLTTLNQVNGNPLCVWKHNSEPHGWSASLLLNTTYLSAPLHSERFDKTWRGRRRWRETSHIPQANGCWQRSCPGQVWMRSLMGTCSWGTGRQLLRWKDALRQLGAQRGGAGERQLRMDEQLKKEKWRQRGGEGWQGESKKEEGTEAWGGGSRCSPHSCSCRFPQPGCSHTAVTSTRPECPFLLIFNDGKQTRIHLNKS